MGLYDREYVRGEERGGIRMPTSLVGRLILANVAVYLVDVLLLNNSLIDRFGLRGDLLSHPWNFFQLLTYGFLHSTAHFGHILFNMYGLYLFGTEVESSLSARRGRYEFLRFYLLAVVVAGLAWLIVEQLRLRDPRLLAMVCMVGASGAVTAVMVMSVLLYPNKTYLLFFAIPVPGWLLGILFVGVDVLGAMQQSSGVAYVAHLGGAAFGFLYFRYGWNLGAMVRADGWSRWWRKITGPRLRISQPPPDDEPVRDRLEEQVDRILEKISRSGEASLTSQERRTLEEASRRARQRRE